MVDYRGRSNSAKESDSYYSVQSLEYETDVESESHSGSFVSDGHNSVDPDDSASVVAHRLSYQQDARRTVQLSNLPPNTIHSEVVAAVKGGPVVDIYVNLKERRAAVSFVHGEHAKRYYDFAQSTGIYMHGSHVRIALLQGTHFLFHARLKFLGAIDSSSSLHMWRSSCEAAPLETWSCDTTTDASPRYPSEMI